MNPSNSQQALDQLTSYKGTIKDPNTLLAESRGKYGIDNINARIQALRGSITNTEQLLGGVDSSVTGRTQGTLTTEAARSKLVNLERAPIAETLATQQGGLSNETNNLTNLTGQAASEAQLAYGGQQDQLGYLKSIYDTLFAKEQAAQTAAMEQAKYQESIRQFNENLALDKQKASDAARTALATIAAQNKPAASGGEPTDPLAQIAYNDVRTRVSSQDDNALKSDYNATAYSAGYGNAKDKLKLEYYKQLRPDLFGNYSVPAQQQAAAPKPAIKTQVSNFVTQPGPGNLSTSNAANNMKQFFGWLPWSGQPQRLGK